MSDVEILRQSIIQEILYEMSLERGETKDVIERLIISNLPYNRLRHLIYTMKDRSLYGTLKKMVYHFNYLYYTAFVRVVRPSRRVTWSVGFIMLADWLSHDRYLKS